MRSVMKHLFSRVPHSSMPRSSFDRSSGVKTTFDGGYLVPMFVDEVLPGDTFSLRTQGFIRLSTPITPVMDNMFVDTLYFFCPTRLLQTNWPKLMGEQDNPADSTSFTCPTVDSGAGHGENSLYDYLGLPTKVPGLVHNNYLARMYNLVYNEWFRDENLQNSVVVDVDDGPDTVGDYVLLRRGKRHDYFTSCLPWPQKGGTVYLPLGTVAPVVSDSTSPDFTGGGLTDAHLSTAGTSTDAHWNGTSTSTQDMIFGTNTGLEVDLSTATAATMRSIYQAVHLQKFFERDARGGTRYIELIKSHFGVTSPDARLQRPEYLGGGSTPMNVTPVAQTSESGTTAQGTLAGIGTASVRGHGFVKSFTEHGYLLGLVNVRADLTYQQGLNRMFSREDKYDFYFPEFQHLGEQTVLNKEIFAQGSGNLTADASTFGYQERYAEYKYKPSTIHGRFRSNCTTPLDFWHLSQDFSALPTLGDTFIQDNPPIDRIVSVTTEPEFIGDFYHDLKCARVMSLYSIPSMGSRF